MTGIDTDIRPNDFFPGFGSFAVDGPTDGKTINHAWIRVSSVSFFMEWCGAALNDKRHGLPQEISESLFWNPFQFWIVMHESSQLIFPANTLFPGFWA
jgi:hypothetical protein